MSHYISCGEKFVGSDFADKLLNTESEIEKGLLKNLEMFKKVITGDEFAAEEKYKPRFSLAPFCKHIWGTNHLPELNIDDEGFYRRLNIIPFEKKFNQDEVNNFDKSKIMTQEALDYLANRALREYLKISKTNRLANERESSDIINKYRQSNNSVLSFLNDEFAIDDAFGNNNSIPKTVMYAKYVSWCKNYDNYIHNKKDFYKAILATGSYRECLKNGYDSFKLEGRKEKPKETIKF